MTQTEWSPGETGYTADGCKVEFIAKTDEGFVVRRHIEIPDECDEYGSYEMDDILGSIEIVKFLFKQAPIAAQNERVRELSDEIAAMQKSLNQMRGKVIDAERLETETQARIDELASKEHSLKNVFRFIGGDITHFVYDPQFDAPSIADREAALDQTDRHGRPNKEQKMLSLYGKLGNGLNWEINQYYDGSGSSRTVHPCLSLEEAEAACAVLIRRRFIQYEADELNSSQAAVGDCMEIAAKYGVDVPPAVRDKYRQEKLAVLERASAEAKEKADEARQKLLAFKKKP